MNERTPDLGDVLDVTKDSWLASIHTHIPAVVESYDASTQSCSVQPELRQARFDEDGNRIPDRVPVINTVPVIFASGGGFRTTYPLQRGDKVWLEICESSLELWKQRGGDVDPADDRRMDISDAVAVTGLRDFAHPLQNCPTDRMSMGFDTGATVEITKTQVLAGGSDASDAVVAEPALVDFVIALTSAIATLGASPAAPALVALKSALQTLNGGLGWKARTSVVKVK